VYLNPQLSLLFIHFSVTFMQDLQNKPIVDDFEEVRFRTVTDDDIQRLNRIFNAQHSISNGGAAVGIGAGLVVGGAFLSAGSAQATGGGIGGAGGTAAAAAKDIVAGGVTNSIDMINAIQGIGLAAFGVALAPMGFMVTLRVLNMVLSRV
jgi:hypothetical protein